MKNLFVPLFPAAVLLAGLLYTAGCADKPEARAWDVTSPDGEHTINLTLQDGALLYDVHTGRGGDGRMVVELSPLGLETPAQSFGEGLVFLSSSRVETIRDRYTMLTGKRSRMDYRANERRVEFANAAGNRIGVVMRASAEGVAFRYDFPDAPVESYTISDERTGFNLPDEGRAWMHPYQEVGTWAPAYESEYQNAVAIGTTSPSPVGWAFPLLFQTGDSWLLITEAGMRGHFYGAHLEPEAEGGLYRVRLPEEDESYGVYPRPATVEPPVASPWRLVMIADNPGGILENSLVHHLSPPSQIEDTSWIQPGVSSWSWWSDHRSPVDINRMKPFIDLSADMGWEYSLIDANWHVMETGTIEELLAYAEEKDVELTLWYNSGGPHSKDFNVGPRDLMHDPEKRRETMAWLRSVGVAGMKIDFMNSDKAGVMQLYLDILADAADHQLVVVFHGSTLPRGWERTWPNLMSMESVRGAEQYTWDVNFAENAALFNTILPFTRNVVGSMDYTPVTFTAYKPETAPTTSWAHELGTAVVFESGIQHVADRASVFYELPEFAWDFLSGLETAWDETRYLSGEPGDSVVLARRKGDRWFIGGLNGKDAARELSFKLDFIDREHRLSLIVDGEGKDDLKQESFPILSGATLKIRVLPKGGFAGVLAPAS